MRDAGGDALLERLDHLDRLGREYRSKERSEQAPPRSPEEGDPVDFDVILAGGGLWSLLAPILASRGLRVAVLDRARIGQSHREWNASGTELSALVRAGLADDAAIASWTTARYAQGVCRFAGGGSYAVANVLDHAIDAGALLAHGRALSERRGVRLFDGHEVVSHASGPRAVRIRARMRDGATVEMTARMLVDARGASSPYATADLVCPTVGGVVTGLEEGETPDRVDPHTGEILATIDGIDEGRQHIWEAFPGRPGETTVYLFYYANRAGHGDRGERVSLADLFARFFATLPAYKRGRATLVRPTFGFIPGWSRLCPPPRAPEPRVVLVGDAAARHSPLTCCGFGATLRSLERACGFIAAAAEGGPAPPACVVDDAPAHAVTGGLARVLASRGFHGDELNRLLDAAFASLASMPDDAYARLLRDEIPPREVVRFLRATAVRYPHVWTKILPVMGARWAGGLAVGVAASMLRGHAAG